MKPTDPKNTIRPKRLRKRPDLIPEPNGEGYRALGGEPGGPISMKEAEKEIGRAIEAGAGRKLN